MSQVITGIEQVTPDWLTDVLRKAGALETGQVVNVETESKATYTATAIPMTVHYSQDAPQTAPTRLFLKLGRRKPEVDFYHFILPETKGVPVIRCYDSAFANHLGVSHVLMDDVSATHAEPPDALPLSQANCERVMEMLACLHAQWWEHPRLAGDLRPILDDVPGFILGQARQAFGSFVDTLGDRISDKRRGWYERIVACLPLPEWHERMETHRQVTLVHGDTHWWNYLLPRESGDLYLTDWAVWHLNIGPSDLAYVFGQVCYRNWRLQYEQKLLRRYHECLQSYGVSGYDWAQCWHDYRLAMVFHAIWPIFHHQFAPTHLWWRNLECCMSAFEDLGCEEFLS